MKITVLASGSGGNATYLETEKTKILIDCGISYRQLTKRLADHQLDLSGIDGIIVTHEHSDHIKGIDVTLRKHNTFCYLTEKTHEGMYYKAKENISLEQIKYITPYREFAINDITIFPLSISHDSNDAVGYVIKSKDKKIVYITDVGYLPQSDHEALKNANLYVFESNYDVTKLFTSNRPFYLKQRIDSVKGHMSNSDSAYNLAQLVGDQTKKIILAHRSKECNTDELVLDTYNEIFSDYQLDTSDYEIEVAKQDVPTTPYIL